MRQAGPERGTNSRKPGMGWGSLQGRKKRPGTRCWERQRGKGRRGEGRLQTCQQPGQGEPRSWRLLIRIHSTSAGQISEPAARGRRPPCSRGEVSSGLRREGLFPRRGVTGGTNLWGSKDQNPNRCSEALSKHETGPSNKTTGVMTLTCEVLHRVDLKPLPPKNSPSGPAADSMRRAQMFEMHSILADLEGGQVSGEA